MKALRRFDSRVQIPDYSAIDRLVNKLRIKLDEEDYGDDIAPFADGSGIWKRSRGYGQSWMVGSIFSSFKRTLGEYVSTKTTGNMVNQLMLKASLYNLLIGLTISM